MVLVQGERLKCYWGVVIFKFRGAINPARDIGPRCVASFIWGTRSFVGWPDDNSYYFWWNPIIGPMIGGAIGK